MEEAAIKGLVNYGAIGIVLALVLGLFLYAFKRMFDMVLKQQEEFKTFMTESVKALQDLKSAVQSNCSACRNEVTAELKEEISGAKKELISGLWKATGEIIEETRRETERISSSHAAITSEAQPLPLRPAKARG